MLEKNIQELNDMLLEKLRIEEVSVFVLENWDRDIMRVTKVLKNLRFQEPFRYRLQKV